MEKFDVIIIGAGAAGLMAANILCDAKKKVCIIEARERSGGRVHTAPVPFSKPIETSAEFIHGNLPVTTTLLKKYNIEYYRTEGELWQLKNGELIKREDFIEHADQLMKKLNDLEKDMSIAELLETYFCNEKYTDMRRSLRQYIEGYEAADISDFSSLALKAEWESADDEQYRIEGGYGALLGELERDCRANGCAIHFDQTAKTIKWKEQDVAVMTKDNNTFSAGKIIITVPLPLLADGSDDAGISFDPQLPVINEAAKQIGYGGVIKIIIEFDHAFWETGEARKAGNMFFVFSEEKIPTWWTQLPDRTPILTGWLAGPAAKDLAYENDEKILEHALRSLCSIFDINIEILQQYIKHSLVCNWVTDRFSKGAYSYSTVTSAAAKKIFATPVAGTLFFAGEAFDPSSNATVDAALTSGKNTAEHILRQ
jgi:monoamine oxidase